MSGHLDWFTSRICGGEQEIHIRPAEPTVRRDIVHLDEVANDPAIDWSLARQAVLRAFAKTGLPAVR